LYCGETLFDGQQYFDTALRALGSCDSYTEVEGPGVKVEGTWHSWKIISWRITIKFSSGEVLEVLEFHEKKMKIKHYRKAKYHFMDGSSKTIFRIDTHKASIPFDEPCHIHIGENEDELEEDDPRLHGQSLVAIEFLTVFNWVHQHLEGKPFPWQQ
jgi:hypothetical protein